MDKSVQLEQLLGELSHQHSAGRVTRSSCVNAGDGRKHVGARSVSPCALCVESDITELLGEELGGKLVLAYREFILARQDALDQLKN